MSKLAADDPQAGGDPPRENDYVVVARRYRPQTFTELVGQEHVARALSNAISSNRVGHAYLFTGARGVGKTSSARILAKALNCVHGPTPTPCNQCDICQAISTGDDVDVLEIDGASNRGIDEIRELRQNVNIRPSRSRFKIYIIDEVHMLTAPAFNALLKTLEEPPERVKFIFCTTEAEKIPITILSRCQRFDFAGIETGSIATRLAQIAEAEGVRAEPEALELLARRAAGSMRDSQSLLEQLLAFGGDSITTADVHAMLGTAGTGRVMSLVERLTEGDAGGALADFDQILSEGVDVGQLLTQLLGFFRDVLVTSVGGGRQNLIFTGPAEHESVAKTAETLGVEAILVVMQILDQALARLRFVMQPRVIAELALVRIARLENLAALTDLIAGAQGGAVTAPAPRAISPPIDSAVKKKLVEPAPVELNRAATLSDVGETNGAAQPLAPPSEVSPVVDSQPESIPESVPQATVTSTRITSENALALWQAAIEGLTDIVADFARRATEVSLAGPDKLVVRFPAEYGNNRNLCQRPEQLAKLEQAVASQVGRPMRLEFELLPPSASPEGNSPASRVASERPRVDRSEHPMLRRAADLFGARATRIDEPKPGPTSA